MNKCRCVCPLDRNPVAGMFKNVADMRVDVLLLLDGLKLSICHSSVENINVGCTENINNIKMQQDEKSTDDSSILFFFLTTAVYLNLLSSVKSMVSLSEYILTELLWRSKTNWWQQTDIYQDGMKAWIRTKWKSAEVDIHRVPKAHMYTLKILMLT